VPAHRMLPCPCLGIEEKIGDLGFFMSAGGGPLGHAPRPSQGPICRTNPRPFLRDRRPNGLVDMPPFPPNSG